jgi:transcriptional regulator with XRE-family HTH domain
LKLGAALRALRKENGWTLSDVSQRTGMPVSTLSKVENEKVSPTYDRLVRLSAILSVDIRHLLALHTADHRRSGRRSIHRATTDGAVATKTDRRFYPASELLGKRLLPVLVEPRARTLEAFGPLVRYPGEQYAFVLEGACEFHCAFYEKLRLECGDSLYFDSAMPHAFLNAAAERCLLLTVCSTPDEQLRRLFLPNVAVAGSRDL